MGGDGRRVTGLVFRQEGEAQKEAVELQNWKFSFRERTWGTKIKKGIVNRSSARRPSWGRGRRRRNNEAETRRDGGLDTDGRVSVVVGRRWRMC